MAREFVRHTALLGSICFSAASVAAAAPEPLQPLTDIPTDIKSQPLADALTAWAELTGYQIVVPQSDAAERITAPVKGNMTAQESMERLLAGTGLIFERINARTVAIREDISAPLRIEPKIEHQAILASVERIEVTGSRLLSDIRADGSVDTPTPVVVFDREKLDRTGISSVSELMKFIPQQPYGPRAETRTENGVQAAEMRGLGFDKTLVLFSGRRIVPSATSVAWNAFDLHSVPLAAIERVEVLSDSGSAVYGADAIGGVINFILKKDIPHPILDVHYGSAAGGAEERQVSLSAGYSNERLRTSLVLDYFEQGTLLGAERDRWNNQDFRRFGGTDYRSLSTNPGNVSSRTSANLPGLPSRFATVPAYSTGVGLTPDDFLATAGQRNTDSLNRYRSIVPAALRRSVTTSAEFDLTSAINVFGEFMYLDNRTAVFSPLAGTLTVPVQNPFNPFGVAVSVDYLFRGLTAISRVASERYRAVAGLRGASGVWEWELSAFRIDDKGSSWRENGLDPVKVNAALAQTDPAKALNVFREGPGGSESLLATLIAAPTIVRPYVSDGTQASAVLRGPLFTLPAGDVETVVGSEWFQSGILFDSTLHVARSRTAAAGFAELRAPLVNSQMQIPAIQKLSLTLAARYDRYSDFGQSFNSQYGLVWFPITDLALRASYGTAFRAPSLFELYASQTTVSDIPTPDPLRDNEVSPVTFEGGGNPDLEATDADSLTVGFDWTPSALQGLQLAASYWRIQMRKQVSALPYNVLAEHWEEFPDRVIRAAPTADDIAAGRPGKLIFMDLTRINFGTTETSGVDVSATYSIDTPFGRLSPSLSATWTDKYETANVPGKPTNRLGIAALDGTIAKWKTIATLGWDHYGVGLLVTARYTAAYTDVDLNGLATGRIIPSQTLIDLQGSLDLDGLLRWRSASMPELKVTVGVSNLFDEEPHFADVGYIDGYDTTQGDLRQRFGYLRLSAHF